MSLGQYSIKCTVNLGLTLSTRFKSRAQLNERTMKISTTYTQLYKNGRPICCVELLINGLCNELNSRNNKTDVLHIALYCVSFVHLLIHVDCSAITGSISKIFEHVDDAILEYTV